MSEFSVLGGSIKWKLDDTMPSSATYRALAARGPVSIGDSLSTARDLIKMDRRHLTRFLTELTTDNNVCAAMVLADTDVRAALKALLQGGHGLNDAERREVAGLLGFPDKYAAEEYADNQARSSFDKRSV